MHMMSNQQRQKYVATAITSPTLYFAIESDSTDYIETDDENIGSTYDETIIMTPEEKEDVKYLSTFESKEGFDEQVMTIQNVDGLNKYELSMTERRDKGYYCCKVQHEELYNENMLCYAKYITPDMRKILMHNFSIQKNEALNRSVATVAPKGMNYSKSVSL